MARLGATVRGMTAIVFIHGAWVNGACWHTYRAFFSDAGYTCSAPCWPHLDDEPPALRANPPQALATLGIHDIVDHYAAFIRQLPEPPILIGHSFGGLFVQMLLAQGLGKAGVAIHPAPPRGVLPSLRAVAASSEVLLQWGAWKKVVCMSPATFGKDFANGLPDADKAEHYERFVVPSSGRLFFQAALALFKPSLSIDFGAARGPLLLIGGGADRTITADMTRANHRRYARSAARTDYLEYDGRSHYTLAEPGWERVCHDIHTWLQDVKATPATQA